jgi:hypothetical protein
MRCDCKSVDALILILRNTALQFAFLFGAGLISGAALTFLSRLTNNVFRQFRWPSVGIYLFGWIGVPVHEFCHAFFCRIFFHKIQSITWFDPKGTGGSQGSVTHTYQPWNPYQRVGHFFIGLAPVLLGPAIITGVFLLCVPSARTLYPALTDGGVHGGLAFAKAQLAMTSFRNVGFWIFVYVGFSIASQIELSKADLKQAAVGLVPVMLILLFFNFGAWALDLHWHSRVVHAGHAVTAAVSGVYAFAAIVAVAAFIVIALVFGLINFLCGRGFINPFQNL